MNDIISRDPRSRVATQANGSHLRTDKARTHKIRKNRKNHTNYNLAKHKLKDGGL